MFGKKKMTAEEVMQIIGTMSDEEKKTIRDALSDADSALPEEKADETAEDTQKSAENGAGETESGAEEVVGEAENEAEASGEETAEPQAETAQEHPDAQADRAEFDALIKPVLERLAALEAKVGKEERTPKPAPAEEQDKLTKLASTFNN